MRNLLRDMRSGEEGDFVAYGAFSEESQLPALLRNQNRSTRSIPGDLSRCDDGCMGDANNPHKDNLRKPYEKPTATKLTSEEAKAKLIDHASRGNQEAKEILEMMFSEESEKLFRFVLSFSSSSQR